MNMYGLSAGLKDCLRWWILCERDTSSRGGKIKSNKNWHFPLLIGFPLKLSFPSIFPFANFFSNHYCMSNRINEHIHIFFCFVAYAIAFRIIYRPLFFYYSLYNLLRLRTLRNYGKKPHPCQNIKYSLVKYAEWLMKKNLQKGRSKEGRAREGNPQGGENAGFCRIYFCPLLRGFPLEIT